MPTTQQIEQAYNCSGLNRCGITLTQALDNPMFKTCLTRIADAISSTTKPQTNNKYWWQKESEAA